MKVLRIGGLMLGQSFDHHQRPSPSENLRNTVDWKITLCYRGELFMIAVNYNMKLGEIKDKKSG